MRPGADAAGKAREKLAGVLCPAGREVSDVSLDEKQTVELAFQIAIEEALVRARPVCAVLLSRSRCTGAGRETPIIALLVPNHRGAPGHRQRDRRAFGACAQLQALWLKFCFVQHLGAGFEFNLLDNVFDLLVNVSADALVASAHSCSGCRRQTVDQCELPFNYLTSRLSTLMDKVAPPSISVWFAACADACFRVQSYLGKSAAAHQLLFLKLVNNLLRRLSKTNDTVFCGRLLMVVARAVSVDDRSGLNLSGAFNTGNSTGTHATAVCCG